MKISWLGLADRGVPHFILVLFIYFFALGTQATTVKVKKLKWRDEDSEEMTGKVLQDRKV